MLGITPIAPLYIGVSVPSVVQFKDGGPDTVTGSYTYYETDGEPAFPSSGWNNDLTTAGNVAHTYEKIQVGVGFTIENIGLVRAQYVGASHINPDTFWTDNLKVRRIEAAFAFTGMEGLVIDVGGKIPLAFSTYEKIHSWDNDTNPDTPAISITQRVTDGTKYQAPFQVSLGAGYTLDALAINGRVDAQFAGNRTQKDDSEYNIGPYINVHLWPSYNLGFATVGLDVGFEFLGEDTDKDGNVIAKGDPDNEKNGGMRIGFGAWLKKSYGGSSIKGGLAYHVGTEVHSKKEPGVFSIPVIFEYTF
jgi:hypothetical protein